MNIVSKSVLALVLTAGAVLAQDPGQQPTGGDSTTIVIKDPGTLPPSLPPIPTSTPSTPPTTGTTAPTTEPSPSPDPGGNGNRKGRTTINIVVYKNGDNKELEGATVEVERKGTRELTTDKNGRVTFTVKRETEFEVTVTKEGFDPITFKRKLGKEADWATARVELFKKSTGTSFVGEFRVGRSADNEDPERDSARFNFTVKYYKDHSPIKDARIVLSRGDGNVVRRETTDAQGEAEIIIRENSQFHVAVRAEGYAEYTTRLSPGQMATSRRVVIQLRKK